MSQSNSNYITYWKQRLDQQQKQNESLAKQAHQDLKIIVSYLND
ncbi:hypothetical protein PCC8801_3360 [Rippkaea orientalis PCC 8801]|uniref:Uncharacterized protein n=1 Tax=Rippkaea orientalis (strain PCC 8801 / RF-1) TaxID=41431 RepID=B7JZB8_RIPO1|nr:hypothetical protein [Rippkaea orientalis]ACK67329.1 hypothetical protein PCC8801_3360 [Rippkaea orientalis PCC 8801]